MNNDKFLWVEKYRPRTINDCILPISLKETFNGIIKNREVPNLLLIGGPGCGKTTVAKAISEEIGCDYLFINGSDENGIDVFRNKITNYATSVSFSGGKKVIIIDEAGYLNPNSVQPAMRSGMEQFSDNCTFILTENYQNKILQPIQSRCCIIDFKINKNEKKEILTQFFKRICYILDNENIKYNKDVIASIILKYFPDFRKVINELQRYSTSGSIDVGILSQSNDIQLKVLVEYLKEKNFNKVRDWVTQNIDNDINLIYRKIYDGLYNYFEPSSIPLVILLIAKYQYQTAFVVDNEIQLIAFLTEVMLDAKFK